MGALITRDTQRRGECGERADGSAWDNSELIEGTGLPEGKGGGDHLLEGTAGNTTQRRRVCYLPERYLSESAATITYWGIYARQTGLLYHFLKALETLRSPLMANILLKLIIPCNCR